jgi:hypothetical protein
MTVPTTHRTDCEGERTTTAAGETPRRTREAEYALDDGDLDDDTVTPEIDVREIGRVYASRKEALDAAREIKDRLRR